MLLFYILIYIYINFQDKFNYRTSKFILNLFSISSNSVLKREDSEKILKYLKHAFSTNKRDSTFLLVNF